MRRILLLAFFGFTVVFAKAQDFTIINPPLPTRVFKHLLVVGSVPGQQWMFAYANAYEIKLQIEEERDFLGRVINEYRLYQLCLTGDWQVFTTEKDEAILFKEKNNKQVLEELPLWWNVEERTPYSRRRPVELFRFVLRAAAPRPRPDPLYKEQLGLRTKIITPENGITTVTVQPAKVIFRRAV